MIVYADEVKLTGTGNSGPIVIEGLLIAKKVTVSGNAKINLRGAIITEEFIKSGTSTLLDNSSGINDDGSGGGNYPPFENETSGDPITIDVESDYQIIDMETIK